MQFSLNCIAFSCNLFKLTFPLLDTIIIFRKRGVGMINIDGRATLEYVSSGLFSTSQKWIHPQRSMDSYEIIYVTNGDVYIEENGVEYHLTKGQALLLCPETVHRGSRISEGETEFFWMHFMTNNIGYYSINKQIVAGGDYMTLSLFRELLHIANSENTPEYAKTFSCGNIIAHLAELDKKNDKTATATYSKISEWIRLNIYQEMTVQDIAERFGYNKTYISRIFKRYSGMPLKTYINNERIKCIKEFLLSTDMNIRQISDKFGFNDENLFVKFFKYHEQMSPTKFRNLYYKIHMNNK